MSERFNSVEDVADQLQVDKQTVRRWIKEGRLAAVKPGLEWRIRQSDLDVFLEARSYPKGDAPPSLQPTFSDMLREGEARRITESLIYPWVVLLEADAAHLTEIAHAGKVDRGAYEKLSADRRTILKGLDALGKSLEELETDQGNRGMRRVYSDLQGAVAEWVDAWLKAKDAYLGSLADSELARARRALAEEEEEIEHTTGKWRAAS
jgi:excisionase family DNA binding protein